MTNENMADNAANNDDNKVDDNKVSFVLDALSRWEQEIATNKQAAIKFILKAMHAHEVKCIVCEYSGSGDSGSVEETHVLQEPIEPEDYLNMEVETDTVGELALRSADLSEVPDLFKGSWCKPITLFDAIGYAADYVTPSGYENNEGGQGVIVFDAVNNECRCEHGSNYTEVNYSSETISLEEPVDEVSD